MRLYQNPALAAAGYRVISFSRRGHFRSEAANYRIGPHERHGSCIRKPSKCFRANSARCASPVSCPGHGREAKPRLASTVSECSSFKRGQGLAVVRAMLRAVHNTDVDWTRTGLSVSAPAGFSR